MSPAPELPRVSMIARILAETVIGIIGIIFIVPIFLIIALTGRPPRWWGPVDEMLDIDKTLNKYTKRRSGRK